METPVLEGQTPPSLPKIDNQQPQPPAKKRRKWLLPVIIGGGSGIILLAIIGVLFFVFRSSENPFKPDTSLIPVYDGEHWGYINKKGTYIINPQFKEATWFNEGYARVMDNDGNFGFIDKKGNYVISPQYVHATIFNEGLAFVVKEGGYPVCINKKGNTVFEFRMADGVGCFQEGLAPFYTLNEDDESRWGYVNKKGDVVINPQFSYASNFCNGLAPVANDKEKIGFIDKTGIYVINPQFDNAGSFQKDGLAPFKTGDKWGFIDKKGKYIINPQFDGVSDFHNGKAVIRQNEKLGFINTKGEFIINPQFDDASLFFYEKDIAAIRMDGKVGFIDEKGKYVINPQFDFASDFCDGFSVVMSGEKYGLINEKGNFIVNPQFEEIKQPFLDFSMVKNEYYDATEFLNIFLSNFSSSEMDGLPVTTVTLSDIAENDQYADKWKSNTWSTRTSISMNEKLTKDIIQTETEFEYLSNAYTYSYDWWSYDKVYDYSTICAAASYSFDLENKAAGKYNSISASLCNELKRIYGGTISTIDSDITYSHIKTIKCNNINFIVTSNWGGLVFTAYFDEDAYDKAIKEFTSDEEDEYPIEEVVVEPSAETEEEIIEAEAAADEWY